MPLCETRIHALEHRPAEFRRLTQSDAAQNRETNAFFLRGILRVLGLVLGCVGRFLFRKDRVSFNGCFDVIRNLCGNLTNGLERDL